MSSWGRLIFENDRRVDAGEHEIELDDGSLRISRTYGDERVESSDVDADARDVGDVTRSSLRELFSVLE
ncbi:MAG: hypothetical protein SV760_04620, partial [Halobacteria archaeon]|nr:hypothetical protein [Halobacteria archaeon]